MPKKFHRKQCTVVHDYNTWKYFPDSFVFHKLPKLPRASPRISFHAGQISRGSPITDLEGGLHNRASQVFCFGLYTILTNVFIICRPSLDREPWINSRDLSIIKYGAGRLSVIYFRGRGHLDPSKVWPWNMWKLGNCCWPKIMVFHWGGSFAS